MKKVIYLLSLVLLIQTFIINLSVARTVFFANIGDFGSDSREEGDVARLIKSLDPEFIITNGDNNYPSGCQSTMDKNIGKYYHEYIYNYQGRYGRGSAYMRFFPTLGNHDWDAEKKNCLENGRLPYQNYFTLPGNGRYYDFVIGSVHFFALDSDDREPDGNRVGSRQYQWFRNKILSSRSKFKVVFFHHAPFSSGDHGSSPSMRWDFKNLGADLVLSGHDHDYERIHQNGLIYVVNGLGGARSYTKDKTVPGSQVFYNKAHGALFVWANESKMHVEFRNYNNVIVDQFEID